MQTEPKNKIDRDGWIQSFPAQPGRQRKHQRLSPPLGLLSWDRTAVANTESPSPPLPEESVAPHRDRTESTLPWARPGNQINPEWVFAQLLLGAALNKHWRVRPGRRPREPVSHPRSHWGSAESTPTDCWAAQAGLLTPLTLARHRLSPLTAFTSGAYTFFTMEGGDSEFAKFTLPTLKAFLQARSQNVSGNTQ